jgi:16S rRNA (guanine527-N7)-methyltransferase
MIDAEESGIRCVDALPLLLAGVSRLGIALDGLQRDRFAAYCRLLQEGNRRANLTGIRAPDAIMINLFLDSLSVDAALPIEIQRSAEVQLVDVGSGAGFPGLPLAIMHPNWSVLLVDSTGKKVSFMKRVIADLGLKQAAARQERAEAIGAGKPWREAADLCTARAVASLDVLLEYCAPLARIGGWLAFPKSGDVEAEVAQASDAALALGAAPGVIVPVPPDLGLGDGRATVLYRKLRATPPGYPRRVGLARSRPIGRSC